MNYKLALAISAALFAQQAAAGTNFSNFTALSGSVAAGSLPETAPFQFGNMAWTQKSIADRTTQLGLGQFNSGNWDMVTTNVTGPDAGRYLFTVFETGQAGIQRTDLSNGTTRTLWQSPIAAPSPFSHVAFDASYWTPWGTFITAEESWGAQPQPYGRLFEVTNPLKATGTVDVVHRNIIPRTSHEGIQFDKAFNMYFIDELNGGALYRYTSNNGPGEQFFASGKTSVLRVGDGFTPNAIGAASWIDITDMNGDPLASSVVITDPNFVSAVDARASADVAALKGTDYQRPEDLQIKTLGNGDQLLFMATTTTHEIYTINLATNQVSLFANRNTIDEATGLAVGSALTNPDNLALDTDGNLYIVEDQPGGVADIWFGRDANNDGIAESLARWATMSTVGAEPTGLYFDPFNPNRAWVNIQHPNSGVDRLMEIQAVPVPAALPLMLSALGGVGVISRRKAKKGK